MTVQAMKLRTLLIEVERIKLLPAEWVCPYADQVLDRYRQQPEIEPLKVVSDGQRYWVWDGYHRLKAIETNRNDVLVTIYRGDEKDAYRRYIRDKLSAPERAVFSHCLARLRADWMHHDPKTLSRLFGRKPRFFENILRRGPCPFRTKHGSLTVSAH